MFSKGVPSAEILWFHLLFKIQVLKYVKRDQKLKKGALTFLRLNLAEIWLKKQAPAPGFHLGTSNGDLLLLQCGKPNKKFTSHLQNHQQWVKHPRMEGVSWHPDLGHVALDAVAFGISWRFRRKAFHEARGPGEPRHLLHLREQCGALRVHLAWSRSKKVQVPLEK